MKHRPTLGQVTHILMIVTLSIALWTLLVHNRRPFAYKSGDHMPRSIWKTMPDAKPTVVIVGREECGFCRASMPFYSKLVRAAADAGVEVVSVTPDDNAAHLRYLDSYQVHVDRIIQLKETPRRVSGTPTLIVMDKSKTILGAWVGQLTSDDEDKVLHLVGSKPL